MQYINDVYRCVKPRESANIGPVGGMWSYTVLLAPFKHLEHPGPKEGPRPPVIG